MAQITNSRQQSKKAPRWGTKSCRGKPYLEYMIINGLDCYQSGPLKGKEIAAAVLHQSHEIFKIYRIDLFTANCKSLRVAVVAKKKRAESEDKAINEQIAAFPLAQFHTKGISAEISGIATDEVIVYPVWGGHIAQKLLRYDIQQGILQEPFWNPEELCWERMFPRNLRRTRPVYSLWPLKVFRDHIHSEIKAVKQDHWNRENGVYGYIPSAI
jgi:hypothetical protein